MYKIQANESGTRTIEVSENNLAAIEKYNLFQNLIESNGIVDETILQRLRMNVKSMVASNSNDESDLLDLCAKVIFNDNMKAFGLHNLILLYTEWQSRNESQTAEE